MILFLRNKNNQTIFEADIYVSDDVVELHSTVDIENYSKLLTSNLDRENEIIRTFDELSELRGWMWERYFSSKKNKPKELNNVIDEVRNRLTKVAKSLSLSVVTD